ncbi:hypothetical protein DPEC_G00246760, partial [Dallia pectoralis]
RLRAGPDLLIANYVVKALQRLVYVQAKGSSFPTSLMTLRALTRFKPGSLTRAPSWVNFNPV